MKEIWQLRHIIIYDVILTIHNYHNCYEGQYFDTLFSFSIPPKDIDFPVP